jgi:hypothetical protein
MDAVATNLQGVFDHLEGALFDVLVQRCADCPPFCPSITSKQLQKKRREPTPPGGKLSEWSSRLEREPRTDLHHSGLTLDLRKVSPVVRSIQAPQSRIASYSIASSAQINQPKTLMVGDVKDVQAKLKLLLLAPRHV